LIQNAIKTAKAIFTYAHESKYVQPGGSRIRMRQLIIAVLMLLSLSAQASTAMFGCNPSGLATTDCCDPQHCPSPGLARLFCDQTCSTDSMGAVAVAVERDLQTPPPYPIDGLAVLVIPFYELLATADVLEQARQSVEPFPTARYPSSPTYLATARLRL
jgi:hypothetical protein